MGAPDALSDAERMVVERVARGEPAVFITSADRKPTVRAVLVRQLLLQHAIQGPGNGDAQWPGVRISGARIDGPLEIADCAQPGIGLPTLALENCDIWDPIDLSASRLARLSLAHSNFTALDLREANIDGPFDFSQAGGFETTECWIDARGALVSGEIIGAGARLRQFAPPGGRTQAAGADRRHALWLAGATIHGGVSLTDGFAADGGVSLDAARVSGDVRVVGGMLLSQEGDAFRAQNARVDGMLLMRDVVANGTIWLLGLRLGGGLQLSHTRIFGETPPLGSERTRRDTPHELCSALIVGDAEIGASVRLQPAFAAQGRVSFDASKIGGDFYAERARFSNRAADCTVRAVNLANVDVGASVVFDHAKVEGRFDMAGARIGGKLSLLGARLCNRNEAGTARALEAINVSVGGPVDFGRDGSAEPEAYARIEGSVDLTGSRIGGDLRFAGGSVDNLAPEGSGVAIMARQIQVQASIRLTHQVCVRGAVILTGATVHRDLLCDHAELHNPQRSALYAKDIEIGDDLKLMHTSAAGNVRFERAEVKGSVYWHDLTLSVAAVPHHLPGEARRFARLELMHARIGSRLKCAGIEFLTPARIDLRGLEVATIDLSSARGWGKPHCEGEHCPVSLDGLVYERIEFANGSRLPTEDRDELQARTNAREALRRRAGLPHGWWQWLGPPEDKLTDPLLDWVLRDSSNDTVRMEHGHLVLAEPQTFDAWSRFNPQPYRQLARVLRAQGYERIGRDIAIYEQWATPRTWLGRVVQRLYGAGFGFGLWPSRAFVTFGLYVAIGWGAASVALHAQWLVETPLIATANYTMEGAEPMRAFTQAAIRPGAKNDDATRDLACYDIGDGFDTLVYAFDTVLPFIPLHLESKCELNPELHALRFLRALYTVGGWIVTSLALLTFSGIVKRFDGGEG